MYKIQGFELSSPLLDFGVTRLCRINHLVRVYNGVHRVDRVSRVYRVNRVYSVSKIQVGCWAWV